MNRKNIKYALACAGLILCIIALACFAGPFIGSGRYAITGFDIMENFDDEFAGVASALAFTCVLLLASIIIAFATLLKKGENILSEKNAKTLAVCLSIVAFITFILQCLTLVIPGYNSDYVDLGGGAVASGVMALLGTIAMNVSLFFTVDPREASAKSAPKGNAYYAAPKKVDTALLKELKDLLDSGALTQEEFDAKKKEILGL